MCVCTGRESADGSGFKLLWPSILSSITELFVLDNLLQHRTSQAMRYLHAQITPKFQLLFCRFPSVRRGSSTPLPCGVLWGFESRLDTFMTELYNYQGQCMYKQPSAGGGGEMLLTVKCLFSF